MATETKAWYQSKGMWAGILTIVTAAYLAAASVFPALPSITSYLPIVFAVLGALGIYGRIDANGKITFTDKQ